MLLGTFTKPLILGTLATLVGTMNCRAQGGAVSEEETPPDPVEDINSEPPASGGNKDKGRTLVAWAGDEWDEPPHDVAYLWQLQKTEKEGRLTSFDPQPVLTSNRERIYDPKEFTARVWLQDDKVFFVGKLHTGGSVYFLWVYTGGAPTQVMANSNPLEVGEELLHIGDMLYFSGKDDEGMEPWEYKISDGTARRRADLHPGDATKSSNPEHFTDVDGLIYFTATTATGDKLYKWDPTGNPQSLQPDGKAFQTFDQLVSAGDDGLFLSANLTANAAMRVWWTNGDPPEEVEEKQYTYRSPSDLVYLKRGENDSRLFFVGNAGNKYLWGVNPKDITQAERLTEVRAEPESLVIVDRTLYFVARGSGGGTSRTIWLWKRPKAGVRELLSGEDDKIRSLAATSNRLYIVAEEGKELLTLEKRGLLPLGPFHSIGQFDPANSTMFFVDVQQTKKSELRRLWASEGTPKKTQPVMQSAGSDPGPFTQLKIADDKNYLIFAANGSNSRGQPQGREPWVTQETRGTTQMLFNIALGSAGAASSDPEQFTLVYKADKPYRVYFVATSASPLVELWRTNGTRGGTAQVRPASGNSTSVEIRELTAMGAEVFFGLRVRDNEEASLYKATDNYERVEPHGHAYLDPRALTVVEYSGETYLFFTAKADQDEPRTAYATNGTKVTRLHAGCVVTDSANFVHFGGKGVVIFGGSRGVRGPEPFKVELSEVKEALKPKSI